MLRFSCFTGGEGWEGWLEVFDLGLEALNDVRVLEALERAVAYWADRLALHHFFVGHACVVAFTEQKNMGAFE